MVHYLRLKGYIRSRSQFRANKEDLVPVEGVAGKGKLGSAVNYPKFSGR